MKQIITNYTFNATAKTITLSDFSAGHPVDLKRLYLITDVTTNKILYNFADNSVATATISSNNVITLSVLQGGESNTDALQIVYEVTSSDPNYQTPLLPSNAAQESGGNLAAAKADLDTIVTNTNKIPSSPAQEGGNLATVATNTGNSSTAVGSQSDAAYTSGNGSIISLLKGIFSKLAGTLSVSISSGNITNYAQETGGNLASVATNTSNTATNTSNTATNTTNLPNVIGTPGSAAPSKAMVVAGSDGTNARAIKTDSSGNVDVNVQNASIPVTESGTWTVQPGNTPNTTPWYVKQQAQTAGGATPYELISAATTNATSVKASAGTVYGIQAYNNGASAAYLKLYNKASAPTVGTDTPVKTIMLPAGGGSNIPIPSVGTNFGTGIAFAITGGMANSDTTAVALTQVAVNIDYA